MKRDPDLIRTIMLVVEAAPRGELVRLPQLEGYDPLTVHVHVGLMLEAGLLRTPFPDRRPHQRWVILRLSWTGCDLLDQIRDPKIWRTVKHGAARLGNWSLDTLSGLAKAAILSHAAAMGVPIA